MLPLIHVVAAELKAGVATQVVDKVRMHDGLDIGPKTIAAYEQVIASRKR